MHSFGDKKYTDYACILAVLAQCAIDNAKRVFDVDINAEIDRISKDMDIETNGYPIFWKHVKDKKIKAIDKKFNISKINRKLVCPMNYVAEYKFKKFRNPNFTLPMSYFFQDYKLEKTRRQSKKVEELISKYALELYETKIVSPNNEFHRYDDETYNSDDLLLIDSFDSLIEDISKTYISNTYVGLMSWLIDRAFQITEKTIKLNKDKKSVLSKNKAILLKTLYSVNKKGLLKIFSKNVENSSETP